MSAQSPDQLTPEKCEYLFARYLNAGDLSSLLNLYEPQASHIAPDGTISQGSQAIRLVLDQFITMQPKLDVHLKRVVPAGANLAILYDDWTLAALGPSSEPIDMAGKSVHIVRRQPSGEWLFVLTGVTNAAW